MEDESDSDFEEPTSGKRRRSQASISSASSKKRRKRDSSDEVVEKSEPTEPAPQWWIEVFCDEEARYIAVDPVRHLVDQPFLMDPDKALKDLTNRCYILAIDCGGRGCTLKLM